MGAKQKNSFVKWWNSCSEAQKTAWLAKNCRGCKINYRLIEQECKKEAEAEVEKEEDKVMSDEMACKSADSCSAVGWYKTKEEEVDSEEKEQGWYKPKEDEMEKDEKEEKEEMKKEEKKSSKSKCESAGGSCKHIRACGGVSRRGLCPGSANIRCCMGEK